MLAYFDTSAHDVQTLREVYERQPAPEFLAWATDRGILARNDRGQVARGPRWGNPRQFCDSDEAFDALLQATPSMHGLATAGPRPADCVARQARLHQAIGREAMHTELDVESLNKLADFRLVSTEATDRQTHLNHPELGSRLAAADLARLKPEGNQVQILVSDGLSAEAARDNLPSLLAVLGDALAARKIRVGRPMLARYARVKLAEPIAAAVEAELVVHLLGERPGGDAQAARSLSAYLVFRRDTPPGSDAGDVEPRYEYTVISNIHPGGLPPLEAGAVIAEKIFRILEFRAAGNRLEALLGTTREP